MDSTTLPKDVDTSFSTPSRILSQRSRKDSRAEYIPTAPPAAKSFHLTVRGVLEGAECHECSDALFARTYWVFGPDWESVATVTPSAPLPAGAPCVRLLDRCTASEVVTQLSFPSQDPFSRYTWAVPFECVLRSTNPHGWPQMVVSLRTVTQVKATRKEKAQASNDGRSGNVIDSGEQCLAYSRCFMPMRTGTYRKRLPLLQLLPSTRKQSWIAWWMRERPELRDPTFLCTGDDRVVLSAKPLQGHVTLSLNVTINGFAECGFEP